MGSMMQEQRNWQSEWTKRTIAHMEERLQRGEEEVTLQIREFQHIFMELLAAQQRSERLEDVLCSYAKYAFPMSQPPMLFGGDTKS